MTTRLFKRLFEVHFLHGYYLDHVFWDANQAPKIFQEYTYAEKTEALQHYTILDDLSIEPSPATQRLFSGLKMRWVAYPLGFFTGIEVDRTGPDHYLPRISLPANAAMTFILRIRNPYLYNFTNHALRPTLPGRYYFTNHPDVIGKKDLVLSTPPPNFDPQRFWEMGELVQQTGKWWRAQRRADQIAHFSELPDYRWANTADRVALPKTFPYQFDAKTPVQHAVFTLFDPDGNTAKTIDKTFSTPPLTYTLDFKAKDKLPTEIQPQPIKDGWYTLQVSLNGAFFEQRSILLRSDLPNDASVFGIVEIFHHKVQDGFHLLNADDSLRYGPNPDAPAVIQPLQFQIRLLPRATYWHYQIEKYTDSTLPNGNKDYGAVQYFSASHMLKSAEPRALTRIRTPLQVTNDVYLPNPEKADLKYDSNDGLFISQLFLQTIKLS